MNIATTLHHTYQVNCHFVSFRNKLDKLPSIEGTTDHVTILAKPNT